MAIFIRPTNNRLKLIDTAPDGFTVRITSATLVSAPPHDQPVYQVHFNFADDKAGALRLTRKEVLEHLAPLVDQARERDQ